MFTINGFNFSEEPERCGECPAYRMGGATNVNFDGKCRLYDKNVHASRTPIPRRCRRMLESAKDGDNIQLYTENMISINLGHIRS